MSNLETLSGAKLEALIEKLDEVHSGHVNEFIARGLGHLRGSDIRNALADPDCKFLVLAIAWVNSSDALSNARFEFDARKRYHGTNKPIRQAA